MREPMTLPPLDSPFAAWLQAQPVLEQAVRLDLVKVRLGLRGRTRFELTDGRDAAQRIRSMAEKAGFASTAHFYYEVYEWLCLRLISL